LLDCSKNHAKREVDSTSLQRRVYCKPDFLDQDAMQQQIPVVYFLGTSPGRYQPIIPTFIVGWHPERLRVDLAFGVIVGASAQAALLASPERRYALREIKARFAPSIVSRCRARGL
jgi:hypothetical protein